MKYLLSFKLSKEATPTKQQVKDEHYTLNFVRQAMLKLQAMDETSADLRAISFMKKVKPGQAMTIENPKNGYVVVIQAHVD